MRTTQLKKPLPLSLPTLQAVHLFIQKSAFLRVFSSNCPDAPASFSTISSPFLASFASAANTNSTLAARGMERGRESACKPDPVPGSHRVVVIHLGPPLP